MVYETLRNGWKVGIYNDGSVGGKTVFWKSHGNVIEVNFGRLAPKGALQ